MKLKFTSGLQSTALYCIPLPLVYVCFSSLGLTSCFMLGPTPFQSMINCLPFIVIENKTVQ